MLSSGDADNLRVPLGLFISKDESKEEYDKMIQKLKNKPFADNIAYKHYPNMFVQPQYMRLSNIRIDPPFPTGSTDGQRRVGTSRMRRTRRNLRTCTPGWPSSSKRRFNRTAAEPRRACNNPTA